MQKVDSIYLFVKTEIQEVLGVKSCDSSWNDEKMRKK